MGWMAAQGCCPPPFLSFSVFHSSRRMDGRAQSADGLNCSIFRYGPTLRTDGRTDNVVRGCALGLRRRRRRRRSKRSTHNENVGAGYCRRQSLSLYLGRRCRFTDSFHPRCCLPLSSASTAAWHVAIEATFIRVAPVSYILKRFDFATSRFWESAPKHLYDMRGQWDVLRLHCCQVYEGDIFASTLVHFRNFPHSLKRKPNSHDGF